VLVQQLLAHSKLPLHREIRMNPIIINNELSGAAVHTIHDNVDSLAIDGVNGTWFNVELDSNSSITLSNITAGVEYSILIKNIAEINTITITFPDDEDIKIADTFTIGAGKYVEVSLFNNGIYNVWQVSKEMSI
jgi:hypothetical protein